MKLTKKIMGRVAMGTSVLLALCFLLSSNLAAKNKDRFLTSNYPKTEKSLDYFVDKYEGIIVKDDDESFHIVENAPLEKVLRLATEIHNTLGVGDSFEQFSFLIDAANRLRPIEEHQNLNALYYKRELRMTKHLSEGRNIIHKFLGWLNGGDRSKIFRKNLQDIERDREIRISLLDMILENIISEGKGITLEEAVAKSNDPLIEKYAKKNLGPYDRWTKGKATIKDPLSEYAPADSILALARSSFRSYPYQTRFIRELLVNSILAVPIFDAIGSMKKEEIVAISQSIDDERIQEIERELEKHRPEFVEQVRNWDRENSTGLSEYLIKARADELKLFQTIGFLAEDINQDLIKEAFLRVDWSDPNLADYVNSISYLKVTPKILENAASVYRESVFGRWYKPKDETRQRIEDYISNYGLMVLTFMFTVTPAAIYGSLGEDLFIAGASSASLSARALLAQNIIKYSLLTSQGRLAMGLALGRGVSGGLLFGISLKAFNSLILGESFRDRFWTDLFWNTLIWMGFRGAGVAADTLLIKSPLAKYIYQPQWSHIQKYAHILTGTNMLTAIQYVEGGLRSDRKIPHNLLVAYADSLLAVFAMRTGQKLHNALAAQLGAPISPYVDKIMDFMKNGFGKSYRGTPFETGEGEINIGGYKVPLPVLAGAQETSSIRLDYSIKSPSSTPSILMATDNSSGGGSDNNENGDKPNVGESVNSKGSFSDASSEGSLSRLLNRLRHPRSGRKNIENTSEPLSSEEKPVAKSQEPIAVSAPISDPLAPVDARIFSFLTEYGRGKWQNAIYGSIYELPRLWPHVFPTQRHQEAILNLTTDLFQMELRSSLLSRSMNYLLGAHDDRDRLTICFLPEGTSFKADADAVYLRTPTRTWGNENDDMVPFFGSVFFILPTNKPNSVVESITHQACHMADADLLHQWINANRWLDLNGRRSEQDKLFKSYVRTDTEGNFLIDPTFLRLFSESRAFQTLWETRVLLGVGQIVEFGDTVYRAEDLRNTATEFITHPVNFTLNKSVLDETNLNPDNVFEIGEAFANTMKQTIRKVQQSKVDDGNLPFKNRIQHRAKMEGSAIPEARNIPLEDILAIVSDKEYLGHYATDLQRTLGFINGRVLTNMSLIAFMDITRTWIYSQYPELAEINIKNLNRANALDWITEMIEELGDSLPVVPMSEEFKKRMESKDSTDYGRLLDFDQSYFNRGKTVSPSDDLSINHSTAILVENDLIVPNHPYYNLLMGVVGSSRPSELYMPDFEVHFVRASKLDKILKGSGLVSEERLLTLRLLLELNKNLSGYHFLPRIVNYYRDAGKDTDRLLIGLLPPKLGEGFSIVSARPYREKFAATSNHSRNTLFSKRTIGLGPDVVLVEPHTFLQTNLPYEILGALFYAFQINLDTHLIDDWIKANVELNKRGHQCDGLFETYVNEDSIHEDLYRVDDTFLTMFLYARAEQAMDEFKEKLGLNDEETKAPYRQTKNSLNFPFLKENLRRDTLDRLSVSEGDIFSLANEYAANMKATISQHRKIIESNGFSTGQEDESEPE